MRNWQWLGIAACVLAAPAWSGQTSAVAVPVSTSSAAPASAAQVKQRLAQHEAEVARLQRAVKQQESTSKHASEQLRQQDAEIRKLQKQLQTVPQTGSPRGR